MSDTTGPADGSNIGRGLLNPGAKNVSVSFFLGILATSNILKMPSGWIRGPILYIRRTIFGVLF